MPELAWAAGSTAQPFPVWPQQELMGLNMQLFTHFAIHHRTFYMSMFPYYPMNGKSNKKCGAENKLWFLNQMKHHADHLKNKSPFLTR